MTKPLENIRVLDLTRLLPGAICTMLLIDMGAEVIKVEAPGGGDYARWMPPMIDGLGAFFRSSNRGKKSMVLNLKDERGQEVLHKLVETTDVLVEGFRPGVTKRLKCDYDTLKTINSAIVYCSLSGWGQDGPYAQESGHDVNYISRNGLLGAMSTPQLLGGQIADVGSSYVGVMGILTALLKRHTTGAGDYIDVAMSEAAMPFVMAAWVEAMTMGAGSGEAMLTGGTAFYNVYYSKDGKAVALGAIEPKFWANFCNAIGKPEWIEDYKKSERQIFLKNALVDLFATRTAEEWEAKLGDADCCFTVTISPTEIINESHIQSRGMAGIDEAGVPWMRSPVRLTNDSVSIESAPEYGEHTNDILRAAGYDDSEINALRDNAVIE